jgi:hypothetical protein
VIPRRLLSALTPIGTGIWFTVATAAPSPSKIVPTTYSFDFHGLRTELNGADAIVDFQPSSCVPDSTLGIDQVSKTWRRVAVHGEVLRSFGKGPLRTGDTLAVTGWLSRIDQEFYELEAKTHQFVWGIFPTSTNAVTLLVHSRGGWQATRCLFPDSAFVAAYVRAASLPTRQSARALIRMFLDEYFNGNEGHWGHVRVDLDDLDRLEARDSSVASIWQSELGSRPAHDMCSSGFFDVEVFRRLARYLPPVHKRECVRNLLESYDDVLRQDEEFKQHPPTKSGELTEDESRFYGVIAFKILIPQALSALLVEHRSPEGPEVSVARARRYLAPELRERK